MYELQVKVSLDNFVGGGDEIDSTMDAFPVPRMSLSYYWFYCLLFTCSSVARVAKVQECLLISVARAALEYYEM